MISKVGHIMHGAIEIHIIIKITLCIFSKIIHPTHRNDAVNKIWSFKKKVHTMQGSEGCPTGNDRCFLAAVIADEGNYFMKNIIVELLVADHFMPWVHVII